MPDDTLTAPAGNAFHHIGYACTTIARERSVLEAMGYRLEQAAFSDPVQGVHGCFMVGAGRGFMRDAWWLVTVPGIAILLSVLSINLVGEGLNDALNPRLADL